MRRREWTDETDMDRREIVCVHLHIRKMTDTGHQHTNMKWLNAKKRPVNKSLHGWELSKAMSSSRVV